MDQNQTLNALPETYCDVCERRDSWGCGHTGSQRRDARRHKQTKKHRSGSCWHFDHSECDPNKCKLAGTRVPGYCPFVKHNDASAYFAKDEEDTKQ